MKGKKKKRRRTSVPGCRLDDGVPWLEDAIPLSIFHHPQADPVLHAPASVEVLAFSHCGDKKVVYFCGRTTLLSRSFFLISLTYLTLESEGFGDLVDAHHGRLPDSVQNIWQDCRLDFPTG